MPRQKMITPHGNLEQAVKETAWKQIAEFGAAALSLRAIARELGITAPAIYKYYPNRDALVTALIVDAFTSFGEAQAQSIASLPQTAHAQRLMTLGLAYHQWAMQYPERYHLIFGTPIAGYTAPAEITMPAAACSLDVLVNTLASAQTAGLLNMSSIPAMTAEVQSMLQTWQNSAAPHVHIEVLFLALTIWARVHGLVSLQTGNQFPLFITNPGAIYRRELERIVNETIQLKN